MEHRPLKIACVLSGLILLILGAATIRYRLEVQPMPPEMQCVLHRDCMSIDYWPVPPLTAPRPSDIRPLRNEHKEDKHVAH